MGLFVGAVNKAIEESKKVRFYKKKFNFRLGCVIFKGSRIISSSHNNIRSCSGITTKYRKWDNSLHAEQSAILNAGSWDKLKGCSLLVIKVSKTENNLSMAKPCKFCEETIRYVGIKNVYYSNENGEIVKMDI